MIYKGKYEMEDPKVLIISHNALSKIRNNGKTIEAFFSGWDPDRLAQLYLQDEIPDFDFCSNYFKISDYDQLGKILHSKSTAGTVVRKDNYGLSPDNGKLVSILERGKKSRSLLWSNIHELARNGFPILRFIRHCIWKQGLWRSQELFLWIDEFSPDIVFFQGSSMAYGYEIVRFILDKYRLPVIIELTDDYTYFKYPYSLLDRYLKKIYMTEFKGMIARASAVLTISEQMEDEYQRLYGGRGYQTLLNAEPLRDTGSIVSDFSDKKSLIFLYGGNIGIGRFETLLRVAEAIQRSNIINCRNDVMRLFTQTITRKQEKEIAKYATIQYCGYADKETFSNEIVKSDVLLHVESFDKRMMKVTRLSISTKIPEYMSYQKLIYAIGPAEIASMAHIGKYQAGYVTTSRSIEAIMNVLHSIIYDRIKNEFYIAQSRVVYDTIHNSEKTKKRIRELVADSLIQHKE